MIVNNSRYLRTEIERHGVDVLLNNPEFQALEKLYYENKRVEEIAHDYAHVLKLHCLHTDSSPSDLVLFTTELRDLHIEHNGSSFITETYRVVIHSLMERFVNMLYEQPLDKINHDVFFAMTELVGSHSDYIDNIDWLYTKAIYNLLDREILAYSKNGSSDIKNTILEYYIKTTDISNLLDVSEDSITLSVLETLQERVQYDLINSYLHCDSDTQALLPISRYIRSRTAPKPLSSMNSLQKCEYTKKERKKKCSKRIKRRG
jgi:hypothetical protein